MMKRMKIKYKTPCGLYFEYEGRNLFIDWRSLGEALLNNHMGETLNIASACAIYCPVEPRGNCEVGGR